jgi:biopolymer transport protein ExbD
MAFQLLAFFIFVYHPSGLEVQMEMQLPSDAVKSARDQQEVDPNAKVDNNQTLEVQADVTVLVRTQQDGEHKGEISALTVEDRGGRKDFGTKLDALQKHLEELRKEVNNKDAIKIQGDGRLKWGSIVQVMDACRKAGFENISFAPPPDFAVASQ